MLHISFFLKDIDRQISEFVAYKQQRSVPVAKQAEEYLRIFRKVVKKKSIYEIGEEDLITYRRWLWDHYPSNYMVTSALTTANQLLRFFRCRVKLKTQRG